MINRLPFDDVFRDESGGNVKTLQSDYLPAGPIPIIDQGKDLIAGFTSDQTRLCKSELPVIVFGDHTKCLKFVDFPFAMGADGVKVLKPKIKADTKYLFYYLQSLRITDAGYSRHFKYLRRNDVPLPSFEEQRRIAEVLDRADALRQKRRLTLQKLDTLLQSVFLEMFGDSAENPHGFPTAILSDLTATDDKINYGVVQPGDDFPNGKPLVRVGDFLKGGIDPTSIKLIDPIIEKDYKRSRLKGNEVLVSCVGSIGNVAIVDDSLKGFNIARAVARIPTNESFVNRVYLKEYLRTSRVQRYFVKETRTVSQPTLNIGHIEKTVVVLPPILFQNQFEDRMKAIDNLRRNLLNASVSSSYLFRSLQQQAFSGRLFLKQ